MRQRAGLGDDDLVGQQAVQLQQQGVGVLLVIRVEGRAQFLDLLLDEAKLWDDGAGAVPDPRCYSLGTSLIGLSGSGGVWRGTP